MANPLAVITGLANGKSPSNKVEGYPWVRAISAGALLIGK